MLSSLVRRSLAAAVLAGSAFGAQATLVLAGSGTTVDFYYDDAVWSGKTATVSGDSITFGGSALRADAGNGGFNGYSAPGGIAGLVAVAKNGHGFSQAPFSFAVNFTGSYLSTDGGVATGFSGASVGYGSLAGGAFALGALLGDASADAAASDAASGAWATTAQALDAQALSGNALALFDIAYSALAFGDDSAFAEIQSLVYAVSAAPLANAVPEPGTLALLAAALGMAGLVRRRRAA